MSESNGVDVMKMTKKDFLAIPCRKWDEKLTGVIGVYVLPSRRKHDSGWACMDFVAEFADSRRPMIGFGGCTDDVSFVGSHFRMDCTYPHGIIHIWCAYGRTFSISHNLSSIDFKEEANAEIH